MGFLIRFELPAEPDAFILNLEKKIGNDLETGLINLKTVRVKTIVAQTFAISQIVTGLRNNFRPLFVLYFGIKTVLVVIKMPLRKRHSRCLMIMGIDVKRSNSEINYECHTNFNMLNYTGK